MIINLDIKSCTFLKSSTGPSCLLVTLNKTQNYMGKELPINFRIDVNEVYGLETAKSLGIEEFLITTIKC